MKPLKFFSVIAISFAMTSCAIINDFLQSGGAQLLGEYATDGYIHHLERHGADAESIQQVRDFSDVMFPQNRIDHIQAWNDATLVNKVSNVTNEVLTVFGQTRYADDRNIQGQLQYLNNMIDNAANGINALSNAHNPSERNQVIAQTVFDLSSTRSEYSSSQEKVNRKFNKLSKKDPSIAEKYAVEAIEYEYIVERDSLGNFIGYNKNPTKWGIVIQQPEYSDYSFAETFITAEDLNEQQASYWESLKPTPKPTNDVGPTARHNSIDFQPNSDAINHELEAKTQAINRISETSISQYEFDKTELDEIQKAELSTIAALLSAYPDLSVCLTGHTCNIGTDKINYKKGLQRANAVKVFLEEHGVSADRIAIESAGSSTPIAPNNSIDNRKANRRVTFSVKE